MKIKKKNQIEYKLHLKPDKIQTDKQTNIIET